MIRAAAVDIRAPIDASGVGRMPDPRFPEAEFPGAIAWADAIPHALNTIRSVLDTLIAHNEKYAVLIPLGCGAFQNPATDSEEGVPGVASLFERALFQEEFNSGQPVPHFLQQPIPGQMRIEYFRKLTMSVYNPGFGPDNFAPFMDKQDTMFERMPELNGRVEVDCTFDFRGTGTGDRLQDFGERGLHNIPCSAVSRWTQAA